MPATTRRKRSRKIKPAPHEPQITTQRLALRHEAVWLALSALSAQVSAMAARRPEASVSAGVRAAAETLLADAAPFSRRRGDVLVPAADDLAGLAVQLGQALAGLDAYEANHSVWDVKRGCRVWLFAEARAPILRLRPQLPIDTEAEKAHMEDLKKKLERRIRALFPDTARPTPEPAPAEPIVPEIRQL